MKKLFLAASLLLIQPAQAQSLDQINSERQRLFDIVQSGQASDSDVSKFIDLTKQVRATTRKRFEVNVSQTRIINGELERVERQNNLMNATLFGGVTKNDVNTNYATDVSVPSSSPGADPLDRIQSGLSPEIDRIALRLADSSTEGAAVQAAFAHYNTPFQQFWAKTKDMINYTMPYRGFSSSSLAGDLILGENLKLDSLQACSYAKRRLFDDNRLKVIVMLLEAVQTGGYHDLDNLIGSADSAKLKTSIQSSLESMPESVNWTVSSKMQRYGGLVKTAVEHDAVVNDIISSVHKFNRRGKAISFTAHVIEPTLGLLSHAGGWAGPGAQGLLCGYVYLTGGPETDKIIKELYFDKCLESRSRLIGESMHVALDAYGMAVQSRNAELYTCSKVLIEEMVR